LPPPPVPPVPTEVPRTLPPPPPEFARFERIEQPTVEQYEIVTGVTYEWDNAIVKDVWHIRQMTDEERVAYDNEMLQAKITAAKFFEEQSNIGTTRV